MNGKTAKLIRKFTLKLIENTKEEERNKTPRQMRSEVKKTFYADRKKVVKFMRSVLSEEIVA